MSKWPDNSDGDVFRRLEESDFNFEANYDIDFNIDFNEWPPQEEAIRKILSQYPNMEVIEPDESGCGYLSFSVNSKVSYKYVISMQEKLTQLMQPFGGWCESWGILHG